MNEHKLNMVSSMHREPLIQMKQYENKFLCKFSSISQFLRDVLLIVKLFTFNYIRVRDMVFNATFNHFSAILWLSILLVEKTTDLPHVTDKLSHNFVSSTPLHERDSNSR